MPYRRFKQVKSSLPPLIMESTTRAGRKTRRNQDLIMPEVWEGGELDLVPEEEEEEKGV